MVIYRQKRKVTCWDIYLVSATPTTWNDRGALATATRERVTSLFTYQTMNPRDQFLVDVFAIIVSVIEIQRRPWQLHYYLHRMLSLRETKSLSIFKKQIFKGLRRGGGGDGDIGVRMIILWPRFCDRIRSGVFGLSCIQVLDIRTKSILGYHHRNSRDVD